MLHGMFFFVADPSHIEFWRNWLIGYLFRCRKLFLQPYTLKGSRPPYNILPPLHAHEITKVELVIRVTYHNRNAICTNTRPRGGYFLVRKDNGVTFSQEFLELGGTFLDFWS